MSSKTAALRPKVPSRDPGTGTAKSKKAEARTPGITRKAPFRPTARKRSSRTGSIGRSSLGETPGAPTAGAVRQHRQIYMREDPASSTGSTIQVSKSQKTNGTGPGGTDPNLEKPAQFLEATPDGSLVFFKSHSELTNDANTGPNDESEDLYRYDVATEELVDLTPDPTEAEGARALGIGAISEDGSYVYFVAEGDLASGAT